MEKGKPLNFILLIVAIILGVTIYKEFDFKELKFEKPALAVIYIIVFVASVYLLFKDFKNNNGGTSSAD